MRNSCHKERNNNFAAEMTLALVLLLTVVMTLMDAAVKLVVVAIGGVGRWVAVVVDRGAVMFGIGGGGGWWGGSVGCRWVAAVG